MPGSWWVRWMRQPRSVWLRRAAFQIHLWTGVALSLYVVMLSVTGSALVYRREMQRAFDTPKPVFDPAARRLSVDELKVAALRVYPDHAVTSIDAKITRRNPTVVVHLARGETTLDRLFNPYTGADLGDSFPVGIRFVVWLASLHDDLLLGRDYRWLNGLGSVFATLLAVTGAIVWWPGVGRIRRGMTVQWRARWTRVNWDLHSALGFWMFLLILNWSITGIYLAFPTPFVAVVDALSKPDTEWGYRWGDIAFDWMTRIHFGRWPNPFLKAAWALFGLVPAMLAVTGLMMWWYRSLRRAMVRQTEPVRPAARAMLASE